MFKKDWKRELNLFIIHISTAFSLHESKLILFAEPLKITVKRLPAITDYPPTKTCDGLMNKNTSFGTHSNFFQVNEKIRNVSHAFEMQFAVANDKV